MTSASASSSTQQPDKHKPKFDYAIVRSGVAGGIGACLAKTAVAPLDRVKILFQASNPDFQKYAGTWSGAFKAIRTIYTTGGTRELFQGHSATLLRIYPYAAIKFMAYDEWRELLMPTQESETNARRFTAGALAGLTSVTFTYPLELIRVRMAFQSQSGGARPSFMSAMRVIYNETAVTRPSSSSPSSAPISQAPSSASSPSPSLSNPPLSQTPITQKQPLFTRFPILKFYRGFSVTMLGIIPYAGTGFLFWDALRAHFYPVSAGRKPSTTANLVIGAVSGALSQTASYPFEIVRRRMQVGGLTRPDRWLRWSETVKAIYAHQGWRGFFVGLSIGYLKIVPMTAISFASWQGLKKAMEL
ncbi:coenzyme A transporter [Coniophora puteana RWD-64-598 SS2]|uniref:Coenzyme A transporter n=1 Tax=Coniophora puteana (strain RWD-64-598) TaxID=741705 RepID=A0A5M3MZ58_CONPW|nr:coenzyme A transporter [Coniophora puteana RWD-64-598 SS2]EIW84430.1 coenzyme A transporter [Coniophora puteana RWD-64-598 SS2]